MLISFDVGEQRVAVLEDGQPVEIYLERPGRRSIAGNVYKGVVDSVLPGMEASFVEIGLEKNGFLYVDEIVVPELEGRRHGRRIQDLISRGQQVLVQAVKDPMGTKGARLTTEVSLPGRFLVYTPFGDGIGVSRRLDDDERDRLKAICKSFELPEGGIIVRTAAEGATEEELAGDLALLRKLWSTIQGRAARTPAPALVYREAELPLRVVRDLFRTDFDRLAIDHERTYRRVVSYLKRTSPELAERVEWYQEADPLMERFGVEAAVRSTLDRRVGLPSGGYLIFDYAEAFTVIDVNTGRFVGARGKGATGRLEDTITKNNLEAAKEIVRQIRLRDIGGIIVIDFIDMANPKNRQEVEDALKRELERDRTKTYVVEISPLGLVEMTRQNVTDGPREILTERCPVCAGDGIVISAETAAVDAERQLRRFAAASSAEAFLVELHPKIAGLLIGPAGSRLAEIEHETGRQFAFESREDLPIDRVALLAEGSAKEIVPQALPVQAGDELELLLEETHKHHAEDAIGRLDGYVVAVDGAAGKVGRRVRVRVARATKTVAFATLLDGVAAAEAPVEVGIVAEEEEPDGAQPKPKPARRAPRKKPAAAAATSVAPVEDPDLEGAGPVRPVGEAAVELVGAGLGTPDEKPRPKTRRGTRGGRGRKKPVAALAAEGDGGPDLGGAGPASPPDVDEAVGAGLGPPDEKPKTRRGTGGGRGRTKPAVGVAAKADGDPALVEAAPVRPSAAGAAAAETVGAGADGVRAVTGVASLAPTDPSVEKPKKKTRRGSRGGRGRKKPLAAVAAADGLVPELAAAGPARPAEAGEATELVGAEAPPPDEKPKPKTRRGTRGGRGRKKPAAAVAADDGVGRDLVGAGPVRPAGGEATSELVVAEAATPDEKPKKKTRRGTRGGRGRKRPAKTASATANPHPDPGPELGSML
jgi:ribonuclease G